jgi:hypothetical protein
MLEEMANTGSQNVVSWQPHGKAFRVHQPEIFARTIMRHYFNQTQYKSFQRQLHIYGFQRIKKGKDMGGYYHSLFSRKKQSMSLRMTREKIKGKASNKKNYNHEIGAPDFYKEMGIMEDHHSPCYSENRDFTTSMAKPVPILAHFSGSGGTAAENTGRSDFAGGLLDPSWLDMGEQKVSSSSLKKKNSCCNSLRYFTGNVASVVVKEEHIEDGDEVFFEGRRFYFAGASVPKTPAVVDFLASVTARGPIGHMPRCA